MHRTNESSGISTASIKMPSKIPRCGKRSPKTCCWPCRLPRNQPNACPIQNEMWKIVCLVCSAAASNYMANERASATGLWLRWNCRCNCYVCRHWTSVMFTLINGAFILCVKKAIFHIVLPIQVNVALPISIGSCYGAHFCFKYTYAFAN